MAVLGLARGRVGARWRGGQGGEAMERGGGGRARATWPAWPCLALLLLSLGF
jgi:hypothetical protein